MMRAETRAERRSIKIETSIAPIDARAIKTAANSATRDINRRICSQNGLNE